MSAEEITQFRSGLPSFFYRVFLWWFGSPKRKTEPMNYRVNRVSRTVFFSKIKTTNFKIKINQSKGNPLPIRNGTEAFTELYRVFSFVARLPSNEAMETRPIRNQSSRQCETKTNRRIIGRWDNVLGAAIVFTQRLSDTSEIERERERERDSVAR